MYNQIIIFGNIFPSIANYLTSCLFIALYTLMGFTKLKFPVIVSTIRIEEQLNYKIRPLFVPYPYAYHRRYEMALNLFRKELKQQFQAFEISRQQLDQLLWYKFDPKVEFKLLHLQFQLGNQLVKGNFSIGSFQLKGHTFVCLPAFDHYLFLAKKDAKGKVNIDLQAQYTVKLLLRKFKNEQPQTFELAQFYAPRGTFVKSVELSVSLNYSHFQFDPPDLDQWMAHLWEQEDFRGHIEIEKVGYDLNARYPAELNRSFFRSKLLDRLYPLIYGQQEVSLVLVGPEGVGRHSILHELVRRHVEANKDKEESHLAKIWHIDPTRVISGMLYVGWWQKRFEAILHYVMTRHKDLPVSTDQKDKLLIDNAVALLRIGQSSQNKMTLSDVLRPYLEKRKLQLFLIATAEEWKLIQQKDRRFSDLFQVIRVAEPDPTTSVGMILEQRKILEMEHGCEFTIMSINQLLGIQRNFLKHKALPGGVVSLMNQLAVKHKFGQVDASVVRSDFEHRSGLEEKIFDNSLRLKNDEVHDFIAKRLIGQPEAVTALTHLIHLIKARLNNPERPQGAFLFTGPTGVGKTEAAKVLSAFLLGNRSKLLRFDMNEYIDAGAIHRLIGDAQMPEGQLTSRVRYQPFAVVLLDEIEKAHPSVHDMLLQVLDDGRLTDSQGRVVSFANTTIIMTSNLGAKEVSIKLGFDTSANTDSDIYRKAIEKHFRPEFINRIDQVVIFHPLQQEHILEIARLQIRQLLKRDGFVRRTTILNISPEALDWVAARGFDAKMGGRALKRQIEKDLTTLSAEQLVATTSETPIIFEIALKDKKLFPTISILHFAKTVQDNWLPKLPEVTKGKGFYLLLLRQIEQIEYEVRKKEEAEQIEPSTVISTSHDPQSLNWHYYNLKDRISMTKQRITNLSLGFRDRHFREGPAIPLRLKSSSLTPRRISKGTRENQKDRWFQEEALKEISEQYEQNAAQFDRHETEFLSAFLDVAFLELFTKGFVEGGVDHLKLRFRSLINEQGFIDIVGLMLQYETLLEALDISFQSRPDDNEIHVEGYALAQLLGPEAGIHLFYKGHQNPLPIHLSVVNKKEKKAADIQNAVLRIYHPNATLTDLRTGYSNATNMTTEELRLFLYAGLPATIRQQIKPL